MSLIRKLSQRRKRRELRVRTKFIGTELPRVSIFRSANHIYAQIIDDLTHKTLASCSTLEFKDIAGDKKAQAKEIGKELGRRAKSLGIPKAQFDRGRFLYHGRVQSLADGLRESGLTI